MIRTGKVMQVNSAENSGIIRDVRGKDYLFTLAECVAGVLPPLYSTVHFEKDEDFSTPVAINVKVDQLPRRI